MTKRHAGYVVVLESDIREDDAEEIMNAIRLIRGVVAVQIVEATPDLEIVQKRRDVAWSAVLRNLAADGPPKPRYDRF